MATKFRQIISGAMVAVMLATSQSFCAFAEDTFANYTDIKTDVDGYSERTFTFSGEVVKTKTAPDYTLDETLVNELNGVHPRIFFREEDIPTMREKFVNNDNNVFERFICKADAAVEAGPTEWYVSDNKEENWIRDVADSLSDISLAYVLTQDQKYLDSAIIYIETICSYPHWGAPDSSYYNCDLAASHSLTALGLSYDWLFDVLPQDTKDILLEVVIDRGTTTDAGGWWSGSYLQNHLWNTRSGTAIAATAIMDEYPTSVSWIKNSITSYNTVFSMLGNDGGGHEGMLYWRYGHEFMFRFMHLMKNTWNIDYTTDEYFKNCWLTPYYAFLGSDDWASKLNHLPYGDSTQTINMGSFPELLSYVVQETGNGYAQWLVEKLYEYAQNKNLNASHLGIIFDAGSTQPVSPESMPTSHLFEGLGMVLSRSDWGGSESALYVRSGMNTGWNSYKYNGNAGSSHVHPDIASPVLYGYGEFLLRDDAYGTTSNTNHSQLFIDGKGQYWDKTKEFLNSSYPYVIKYEDKKDYMYVAMNATDAYGGLEEYENEFQLNEWIRHILYIKNRDVLLIVDEVETAAEKELEFRYFPESQDLTISEDNTVTAVGSSAKMKVAMLTDDSDASMELIDAPYRSETRQAISMKKTGTSWTNATAVSWSNADSVPKTVTYSKYNSDWSFAFGGTSAAINVETNTVSISDLGAAEYLVIDGITLDSASDAFASGDEVTTMSGTSNVTPVVQDDGSIFVTQTNTSETGVLRMKTMPVGTRTGKVLFSFDVASNRTSTELYIKYGETSNASDSIYGAKLPYGSGRVNNFKLIVDYDSFTYTLYVNGQVIPVVTSASEYIGNTAASLIIFIQNLNPVSGTSVNGWASVSNFAAYKLELTSFANVSPLVINGVTLNSPESAFSENGVVRQMASTSNVTPVVQSDGSILVTQTDIASAGALRTKTVPIGKQNGKIVFDFDVRSNRSTTGLYIKYGITAVYSDSIYSSTFGGVNGAVTNYKLIIDYDNLTYSFYVNNMAVELSDSATDYISKEDSCLMIFIQNLKPATNSSTNGWATIDTFEAYKPLVTDLSCSVISSTAINGKKAVRFTAPISTSASSAVIDGKVYNIVKAADSSINAYAIDTSSLQSGTYTATLTGVALENASLTAQVTYDIILTDDIFSAEEDSLTEDGAASLTLTNNRNGSIAYYLIVAEYKNVNTFPSLVDVECESATLEGGASAHVSAANVLSSEDSYLKCLIWESLVNAEPLCDPVELQNYE